MPKDIATFLDALAALCSRHDVLLVAPELHKRTHVHRQGVWTVRVEGPPRPETPLTMMDLEQRGLMVVRD